MRFTLLLFFSCVWGSLLNLLWLPIAPDSMIDRNQGARVVKVRLEEEMSVQELHEPRVSADDSCAENLMFLTLSLRLQHIPSN